MLQILLIVIGVYALAGLSVHLGYWISQRRVQARKHYVLVSSDHEEHLEWHMRSFYAFSRWMGKDVRLTIVDRGASRETMAIAERMNGASGRVSVSDSGLEGDGLLWQLQTKGIVSESEHAVLVDLQSPSDLSKLPF